jgi:hypothetical protein
MVKLRQLDYEYAKQIDEFWKEYWSEYTLPDDTMKIIDAVAVDKDQKAIAYGQVRIFAELMLFTDMGRSKKERMEALKLLMFEAFRGVEGKRIEECYCLIKDMKFARLIAKHFDFHLVEDPGILLVKRMK